MAGAADVRYAINALLLRSFPVNDSERLVKIASVDPDLPIKAEGYRSRCSTRSGSVHPRFESVRVNATADGGWNHLLADRFYRPGASPAKSSPLAHLWHRKFKLGGGARLRPHSTLLKSVHNDSIRP